MAAQGSLAGDRAAQQAERRARDQREDGKGHQHFHQGEAALRREPCAGHGAARTTRATLASCGASRVRTVICATQTGPSRRTTAARRDAGRH
jgi:hypothetical protein